MCNSVASRFAAGPCTIGMPTGPALPGGAASFFAGLGGDLVGILQTGICLTNVIQYAANQASGGPTFDSLYRSWLNRLGVDTNSDSTYKSGQIAGDILLLGTGGIGATGDAADAATAADVGVAADSPGAASRLLPGSTGRPASPAELIDDEPESIAGQLAAHASDWQDSLQAMTETAHDIVPVIPAMSSAASGSVVVGAIIIAVIIKKLLGG